MEPNSALPTTTIRHAVRVFGCVTFFALVAASSASFAADEAAPPSSSDPRIEITSSASSWDNLSELFLGNTPAAPFGEGSVFVMRGEIRNKGNDPIHHVVLRYELLDASGKVLHDAEGYNRGAESMRPDEEGTVRPDKVVPLAPGAKDSFRMVFFHDEVPKFTNQRVRVVDVIERAPAATKGADAAAPAKPEAPARDSSPATGEAKK